ncbi:WD40-repeat-containing domain protein [Auriculariales sp. MPI-PUGE-AT-0066]|nr:WD40-repeat-containing domain protein [Auriculariales sp. MPI-PUGE-AT-0066]
MALFADKTARNPFRLQSREERLEEQVPKRHPDARHTASVAFFPWTTENSTTLWNSYAEKEPTVKAHWARVLKDFQGVYAVAVRRTIRILNVSRLANETVAHTVELDSPDNAEDKDGVPYDQHSAIRAIAWAMDANTIPFRPLLLIAASSVLHVYDVIRQCSVGCVKGHGGEITSVVVFPQYPHQACTTSRDYSTRFYNLSFGARYILPDLPRPPQGSDHFCGPPFGMPARAREDSSDSPGELPPDVEGVGNGKCMGVLWGPIAGREELPGGRLRRTRIGGHNGSVLSADFHPMWRNLIATCGVDNAVKIWRFPSQLPWPDEKNPRWFRQQLPIFSSTGIHDARVVSIRWVNDDILLSESTTDLHKVSAQASQPLERRTFVLWQCLIIDREATEEGQPPPEPVYEDIAESTSYRVISSCDVDVPVGAQTHVDLSGSTVLLLVPTYEGVHIYNIAHHFPSPRAPKFPRALLEARRLAQDKDRQSDEYRHYARLQREEDEQRYARRSPESGHWKLGLNGEGESRKLKMHQQFLACCTMSPDMRYVVAASIAGDVYVWSSD